MKTLRRLGGALPRIADLARDLRFAFRMIWRAPAVSVPAILVLALGIGASTALYAAVYAMWLRPLPYPDSGRLVSVTTYFGGYKLDALASPDYGAWQGTRSLGPLGAYSIGTAATMTPGETVVAARAAISGNLLEILRIPAAFGRGIQPADDSPQAPRVAMLADAFWRERFAADPGAVGRTLRIDGEPYTIAGVLPRGFRMPDTRPVDVLTPLALSEGWLRHGSGAMKILSGVARLEPGITLAQARAELSTRLAASRAAAPQVYREDASLRVIPLHEYVVRDARATAIVLMGAVAGILLIAGANVAGLLVARAAGRKREMAVRRALGAGAGRIAVHLLMEGLALGAIGLAVGLAAARAMVTLAPRDATLNIDVLAAAAGAGLLGTLAFSLAPLLPIQGLRLRRALVAAELAISLALTAGAALLIQSLARLQAVSPGFRIEQLVTASLSVRGTRFAQAPAGLRRELRERLQGIPGILAIGFADSLPPAGAGRLTAFSRSDRPLPEAFQRRDNVIVRTVDAGFFESMGIPLHEGRVFTPADEAGNGLIAIVNRTLADRYFAGERVLGKQVDGAGLPWKTVVGVVGDTRNDGLRNPTRPEIYLPAAAAPAAGGGITRDNGWNVVIRAAGDPSAAVAALREGLRALDRSLPARTSLMDQQWQELRAAPRSQAGIFTGFAGLALLMASTGVYGVLSYTVILRRKEIGIRMALGARPGQMQRLIVREALILAAAGAAVGLAIAAAGARLLEGLLYQVKARDPVTLVGTAFLLVALAIGASLLPARRAAHQDPARTLRAE